jgi:hypothetical protein
MIRTFRIAATVVTSLLVVFSSAWAAAAPAVLESAREIPLAYDVDVVVVGGSTGAVAAAAEAAKAGAKVFLAAPRSYLGEDMCGTLRLWLNDGEIPACPLAKAIYGAKVPATPEQVKVALDDALLAAGVQFLTGSFPAGVLRDAEGRPAGVVIANRSGRQAVRAKVIIDASERAVVARSAGARFEPYPAGTYTFTRTVIGGEPRSADGVAVRALPGEFQGAPDSRSKKPIPKYSAFECTLQIPMSDGSFHALATAEQLARDRTWHTDQVGASDSLFQVPPDAMRAEGHGEGDWAGADKVELSVFRPAGVPRLWVLGGSADISRDAAAKLLRPLALIDVGMRIGVEAAKEAKSLPAPQGVKLAGPQDLPAAVGQAREALLGTRPARPTTAMVHAEATALPVLGEYDVVVIGGGTGGAPAGIGAGRQKAKTLVVEYLGELGGVGTYGLIGSYYFGNRVGFTAEHDRDVKAGKATVHVVGKAESWRRMNGEAGSEIWFGCLGCGALVEQGRVCGVIIATPAGRGVVLAKTVIDSTGNADIAAAAGAECVVSGADEIAIQGAGLPPRNLGASYTNTDYIFADETDAVDLWQHFLYARQKYRDAYDVSQMVDTRERRRIVGDFVLSPMDELNRRTFPDTIVVSKSNFDSHGYTVHPLFFLSKLGHNTQKVDVPYRCLLPKGLDGILVTGLGVSAQRDALPIIRMQPDVQNQGYAAGVAAAMAAQLGGHTRQIDIKALQKHLVEKGNLPESVLSDGDSYPISAEKLAEAVRSAAHAYQGVEVILVQPEQSLPLLKKAYRDAADAEAKIAYAHILGMLGDATGAATLAEVVEKTTWDKGWNFRGMGQFGPSVSKLDSLIIALGRTRDPRAAAPIVEKIKSLDSHEDFSHHRAVVLACESLADKAVAGPLAELLAKSGMTGHALVAPTSGGRPDTGPTTGDKARGIALRELMLARALYRCGDHEGQGAAILKQYAQDLRGHFARHAQAVLQQGDSH